MSGFRQTKNYFEKVVGGGTRNLHLYCVRPHVKADRNYRRLHFCIQYRRHDDRSLKRAAGLGVELWQRDQKIATFEHGKQQKASSVGGPFIGLSDVAYWH